MANETMKAATRRSEDDVMISGDGKAKKGSKRIFRTIRHFFRRKSGKHADDEDGSSGIEQSPEWPQSGRRTSDAMDPGYPSPNRDDEESPSSGAPFPISRLSMSHDSVFSPDPQVTSPLHRASVSSLDASSSSLNAKALGMRAISNELKDNPIFRRQRTREIFASGEDLGLPKSPHDSPSASSATSASVSAAQRAAAVLMGSEIRKVVRNRDGRSEGSLLSMGSSEHDEDSGFGQTSRHSSKLSLAEKKSQDGLDWDLGEPPLGAAPLSHSAARHKMAVRPRRTMAGPTRHRRLQQLSASVLPSMPEMNEDAASGSSSMTITKSQSETMHFMSSSSNAASSVTVAGSSSSTTTKVSSTASSSTSNYARRDKMTRASVRPTTPSPTHSPSTKLSRSKSTGADRKIRHEVERFESSKRIDVDPESTPSRYLSPPRRKPEDDDQQLQASSTSVNSAQSAGRESRRRDLRRIKKDKEEKKNASNSASSSKSPPGDDSNSAASAGNHGVAGNTFFSRLFGSRRSYKKKKDEGKHSDGHAATDDDDDDGGFSPHSRDKKNPAASSVSPVRRMDPKGGYAQDADAKFLSPDAYARDAEVNVPPPSIIAGKNPLFKFPLRSNRLNMLPSVSQDEDIGGNAVVKGKSSSDKGEDSVVIQPDVIRKTLLDPLKDPQRPNFLLGSAVTASQPPSGQGLIPPKPARSSLPFGRPSLHHHGNQQPGHSPKPPRIEGLSRFQKKVLLVEDENDEEHVEEIHRISKSAATTPDDDRERLPNILRQARSFRQTNSASNSEYNLKRLSQQPQSSSQELLKDELEAKWQMRKSNASYERIDSKESASTGVQIREKKDAPTDENTENRRRSLFGEILRPTGFFERSHSPVNGNIETGPMSLDSVLTTRTEDSGGGGLAGAGDDYSSNTGSSLNSTGPVSLMVIPPSRPSVVNNKRPLVTIRSSGVPIGGRKPNVVDDDDLYDDEDDDAVREPPLKPKLWDCKIRKFERNAPTSSSGSSTSSASSSSTSTSSCSVGQTPPPASNLMETDLDDDVVEANPIVASFARPSFMAGSGTATTRPRNVPAPAEPESPAPKTVIKIGELRKNSASKIPVLASPSVPTSASLVAAVSKSSSSDEDTPVKMRNKPKPIPNIAVAPTNNGEGGFSRASLRPSGSTNPDQLAANELLKVFQRRSLKAKDAETLQAQVVEMLEKEKPGNVSPPVQEEKPPSPSALSAKPVALPVEKPKLTASKSLGMALSGPSHGTNNNSSSVANANLNAAKSTPTGSPPSGQSDGIPEWKRIAQQRKEKREQLEQLSVRGDGEGENAARNAAARSSKVLDLVNNFQKRTTDLPTTTNL